MVALPGPDLKKGAAVSATYHAVMVFGLLLREANVPREPTPAGKAWCPRCRTYVVGKAMKHCTECGSFLAEGQGSRLAEVAAELYACNGLSTIGDCGSAQEESVIVYAEASLEELDPEYGGGKHVIDVAEIMARGRGKEAAWTEAIRAGVRRMGLVGNLGTPRWYVFAAVAC